MGVAQKVLSNGLRNIRVCNEVLLLQSVDRHLAGWVCSLLAFINIRIVKLSVCIAHWLLEAHTKVGGDWAWPSGYGASSISS